MVPSFSHRTHAGEALARSLLRYARQPDITVLAIPNGGIPVAFEVACSLAAPLDLCLFEPIVFPDHEAPLGLLGWPPVQQLHEPVINARRVSEDSLRQATAQAWRRLRQRVHALRPAAIPPFISGRQVVVVNEGVIRGRVLSEAAGLLRRAGAQRLIAAAPVGTKEGLSLLAPDFDDVVCPYPIDPADALPLSDFYGDFRPVTDDEVRALLMRAWRDWGSLDTSPLGAS
jgi:putative phosphoribosyl transferase